MKKTKVIIPALGILLLSTAASVTGTVAWFSMNNSVSATGMNVQAKAENGIVIAQTNSTEDADWKETAAALYDGASAQLIPTSTNDTSKWYHANSNAANSYAAVGGYEELASLADGTPADGVYSQAGKDYYLLNSFWIKSSGVAFSSDFYVNKVKVSGNTSSADLDKSLRVLVKSGNDVVIFAPFEGATLSYNVHGDTATAAIDASAVLVNKKFDTAVTYPAYVSTSAHEVKVFVYFEGEDQNCKSANLAETLDKLSLELVFGTATLTE